jgi:hypothetical protein
MDRDPLVGTWRKVAIDGAPLTDGTEVLHLRADGTAVTEVEWQGERSSSEDPEHCGHHWQRVDENHWQLLSVIPAGLVPGLDLELTIPLGLQEILELTDRTMRTVSRFPPEVIEQARQQMIAGGHTRPDEPFPPDSISDYERVA